MSLEPQTATALPRKQLLLATGGALLGGLLIVLVAILPAEFDKDPLGVGKLSGLSRLWAPEDVNVDPNAGSATRAREYPAPYRTDVIEIPLGGFLDGAEKSSLEYKFAMKKDATLIYTWEVIGAKDGQDFHYDFHGHDTPKDRKSSMTVATYRQDEGLKAQGALTAPFEGIHGWLFQNNGDTPVVVRLKVAGFYDLIPAGRAGNESNVVPNVPAAQARPDLK